MLLIFSNFRTFSRIMFRKHVELVIVFHLVTFLSHQQLECVRQDSVEGLLRHEKGKHVYWTAASSDFTTQGNELPSELPLKEIGNPQIAINESNPGNKHNGSTSETIGRASVAPNLSKVDQEGVSTFRPHSTNDRTWDSDDGQDRGVTSAMSSTFVPIESSGLSDMLFYSTSTESADSQTTPSYRFKNDGANETSLRVMLIKIQPNSSLAKFSDSCSGPDLERLCGCSRSCRVVNNCCYDSQFIDMEDTPMQNKVEYSCYSEFSKKWRPSNPSILVDKCQKNWKDVKIQGFCEQPWHKDLYSHVPCFSHTTKLSYRNIYCLLCNGLRDCSPWEVTFQSGSPLPFNDIDTFFEMDKGAGGPLEFGGKQFVLSSRGDFESSHCIPSAVSHCKETFKTDKLTRLCRAYYSPVIMFDVFYRNMHCFECAVGERYEDSGIKIFKQQEAKMSALLPLNTNFKSGSITPCTSSECWPTISSIRGYQDSLTVHAVVSVINGTSSTNTTMTRALLAISMALLKQSIGLKLKHIYHEVRVFTKERQTEILPFKTEVIIRDNIAISSISEVQLAIRSAEFHMDIDGVVVVNCCLDEKGVRERHTEGKLNGNGNETVVPRQLPGCYECGRTTPVNGGETHEFLTLVILIRSFLLIYCLW